MWGAAMADVFVLCVVEKVEKCVMAFKHRLAEAAHCLMVVPDLYAHLPRLHAQMCT